MLSIGEKQYSFLNVFNINNFNLQGMIQIFQDI